MKKRVISFLICCCTMLTVSACGMMPSAGSGEGSADFSAGRGGTEIRILSGSENQELEEIIGDCADEAGVRVEIDYKGSVDIMRTLQDGAKEYDAVWPASGIWISMGDEQHLVKHSQSVSITPVVFGIRQSLARELGFTDGDVSVKEITDTTNSLLLKNSEKLKQNTLEVAKESERGIVDVETLKKANENLISTMKEAVRIQQEGHDRRQAAEQELMKIEEKLKQALAG